MTPPGARRVSPEWLTLRGPADARARDAHLAETLAGFLRSGGLGTARRPARLVDVGAGMGAGATWLRPRLPAEQEWRLVDLDASLLAAAPAVVDGWAEPVVADLSGLGGLLRDRPADVVTCQALVDLLRAEEMAALLAPAMASGAAVLLALSVTGDTRITPRHPDDDVVARAFNAHQRRDGRLGPAGGGYAAELLRRRGYAVSVATSPWRLVDLVDSAMIDAWLRGRAAAAAEQEPLHADRIARWLAARLAAQGRRVVVRHVDLLGLPTPAV